MTDGVRCMILRGGSSKGAYFLADDLPADPAARNDLLLRLMGSPDPRQIDGIGGAHPLTSKVAVVARSDRDDADIEYLFLQLGVDEALVTDRQNCGNLLAGVAPFALERGLVTLADDATTMRVAVHMRNTDSLAMATLPVAEGRPVYVGDTAISGVPGTAAEIQLDFVNVAGSSCGALLPTGNVTDEIAGVRATLVDTGMPAVVMNAADFGKTAHESPAELESDRDLRARLEEIRHAAGPLMRLGDVSEATVPKMTMVGEPRHGGMVATRTFIPHRCHEAIGVLGALSVATAVMLRDTPANDVARAGAPTQDDGVVRLEHPTGSFDARLELSITDDGPVVGRTGIVRTARKLMDGVVFPREY